MAVQYPTPAQLREAAAAIGLALTDDDLRSYLGLLKPNIDAYNLVDHMPDELPPVKYPRSPGRFPPVEENPRNAWYV
jgi:amidase